MEKNAGFTLVEILVVIMMLGVATASITSVFISIRNIQLQTAYYDSANRAAAREIESLRNDSYVSLTAGQTINFTSDLPSILPNRSGQVIVSSPSDGIRRVDATVTYKAQGKTRTLTLSSLIGEIGITQ
jgi:prepilin-type N-terminal cleavage/methylation domain-containing protein